MRRPQLLVVLLPALLVAVGLGSRALSKRRPAMSVPSPGSGGLELRLHEGQDQSFQPRRIAPAEAAPLPAELTRKIIDRLPPIQAEADDQKNFALRDRSLPAPRTGETVQSPFPPAEEGPSPETAAPRRRLSITQKAFAEHPGVSQQRINEIINGKRGITAETAWLLAGAFSMAPKFWMNLQIAHDLTRARPEKLVDPIATNGRLLEKLEVTA